MRLLVLSIFILCITFSGYAQIRLPSVFSNHVVLQQKSKIKIWGWCTPAEKISLKASWDTVTYHTIGTGNADWAIDINTPAAGGPYHIIIKGTNTISIEDVLIGEVWLCSGQSNMGMTVNEAIFDEQEINESADNYIRFFEVTKKASAFPQDDVEGRWVICTPETMKKFSAVGYYFGKTIRQKLQQSAGLILASWGGTSAEVWTPAEIINNNSFLAKGAASILPSAYWPVKPGEAFNAMIKPLSKFSLAGVIWYQGENNTFHPATYRLLFTELIKSWRKAWQKELPFYYVQIAPYAYKNINSAALIREAQTQCLSIPKTGMVLSSDLVTDTLNVHPKQKKEIGLRLASYALAETYQVQELHYQSAVYKNMRIEKNSIRIYFTHADDGLVSRNGPPTHFYIAGTNKVFLPATAVIENNTLIVSNPAIKKPVAVRFAFSNAAIPNLFSRNGLPVNLFRTDYW